MHTVAYPSSYSSVTRVTVAGMRVTGRSWPRPLDVKAGWLVSPVGNHAPREMEISRERVEACEPVVA
jgi:hypothetical protein